MMATSHATTNATTGHRSGATRRALTTSRRRATRTCAEVKQPGSGSDGQEWSLEKKAMWSAARKAMREKRVLTGKAEFANRGGLVVGIDDGDVSYQGFVPVSQVDPARFWAEGVAYGEETTLESWRKVQILTGIVGSEVRVIVMDTNRASESILLSERSVNVIDYMNSHSVGENVPGRVRNLTDFGAFVDLEDESGKLNGVVGLCLKQDISWDRIQHPDQVLQKGQRVVVKLVEYDEMTNRLKLSLKQTQMDPLLETLDTLLPPVFDEAKVVPMGAPLPGLLELVEKLIDEDGIIKVTAGRQAQESRVVSQDLELWLTNQKVEDGFNLIARAGRMCQEVHVITEPTVSTDDMKAMVKRVAKKVY